MIAQKTMIAVRLCASVITSRLGRARSTPPADRRRRACIVAVRRPGRDRTLTRPG
jgi:hypothetical protein